MLEVPNPNEWDMIVFDVDGTLLDSDGFHDELVKLARRVDTVSYTHLTLPTKRIV